MTVVSALFAAAAQRCTTRPRHQDNSPTFSCSTAPTPGGTKITLSMPNRTSSCCLQKVSVAAEVDGAAEALADDSYGDNIALKQSEGQPILVPQSMSEGEGRADTADKDHISTPDAGAMPPIAVFKQEPSHGHRCMTFEGWYRIQNLAYLEPRSEELVRMLEQKWTVIDRRGHTKKLERDQSAWEASLKVRWAVIKFEKDKVAVQKRGRPQIERLKTESGPRKSVKEMLDEMRLGSKTKEKSEA